MIAKIASCFLPGMVGPVGSLPQPRANISPSMIVCMGYKVFGLLLIDMWFTG
jgi:hypothetical protein